MCHDHCPRPVSGGEAISEHDVAIPLGAGSLPAFVAFPEHQRAPAILVIHDIHGPNDFYRDLCRRLAIEGYVALLPNFFFRQGPLADTKPETRMARMRAMEQSATITDIQSSLYWLQHLEQASGQVGTIGFCMGGTLVMLAASRDPVPAATVAYYGFPKRDRTPTAPILPSDETEVANLQSPMLAFWGTEDAGVGMDNVDQYDAQLKRYGKDHEFVKYEGIGHGFLTFDESSPSFAASQESWSKTLAFFADKLGHTVQS